MIAQPRCIALVGPFQSGKTTLLEAILHRTGAIDRMGRSGSGSLVGDSSPEGRAHNMGVEPNVSTVQYLGDGYTFIDCPGSVEFAHDMRTVLPVCDAAVVVCEPDDRKVPALALVMRELEELGIPRFLFLNKIDATGRRVRETLASLQEASATPLLLRQIPIWENGVATGFIDLALERGFVYREQAPSEQIPLSEGELPREKEARFTMLERLADHDDALMEALISDEEPPNDRVFQDLARELRDGQVVSVLIGSAEHGHGVTRLLKALRHEAPALPDTRERLGVPAESVPLAQVVRTIHTGFSGKLSVARVLRGVFREGDTVTGSGGGETRIAGLSQLRGAQTTRLAEAGEGEVAGFARLDPIGTGECFAAGRKAAEPLVQLVPAEPVYAVAVRVKNRKDDVRLTSALAKIVEEDPSLKLEHRPDLGEVRLLGQGEMHLRVAVERLASRFQVEVETAKPKVGYAETIRRPSSARGRHKKQSGGHGQFGDVSIEVRPLGRGEGFVFESRIVGGVVPKQYIPSVEAGVEEWLKRGPLGFPMVDLAVTLVDGSYHAVDSSDAAFQAAAKLAMSEAVPRHASVLLEPILSVEIAIPSGAISKAASLVTGRRGQVLGYDARPGWPGWDILSATVPEAEIADLIVELRSATAGVGTFSTKFSHMAEVTGRPAELALAAAG
ncbi:elongation factor G [Enterovirga aerilata]|uniref:Elongation factor G n=1 Tax=Enterovirga aerilata TaxID=2730920 RepID=A0A849I0V1_9HYPH|nr:elongation factor G [Enterovirga sp. DB1703]NNM71021.1 elongation factor G [Enterovirga sp. DB1703]